MADADAQAAQAEAEDSPHVIEICGEEFEFCRLKDWPAKCFDMLQDGRIYEGVSRGLVDYRADIGRLEALWPSLGDLEEVFHTVEDAEGVGSGNSSRSGRGSRSTGSR